MSILPLWRRSPAGRAGLLDQRERFMRLRRSLILATSDNAISHSTA